jgi:hypothetical protein
MVMSLQEKENEIANIKQKGIHSNDSHLQGYPSNKSSSSISNKDKDNDKIPSINFDEVTNKAAIIKTMKEIKYNFMEEHKNIINTYYLIYSKQLDDVICYNLNNIIDTEDEYSEDYQKINQNLIDNQTTNTQIINDIVNSNVDTFIKSIHLAHKFYSDIVNSYCNYIRN